MLPVSTNPTQRFSNRVRDYGRYRPSYPDALIQTLVTEAALLPTGIVADIGAGTGLSSEGFLRYGCTVTRIDGSILQAFFGGSYQVWGFENEQVFDYEGLKGRLLSCSYAPAAGHPDHVPMLRQLERLFTTHQQDGRVRFLYHTDLYFGHLT